MCSANKEACISKVLSPPVGDNDRVWSLSFHRAFNDWELAASYSFFISSKPEFLGEEGVIGFVGILMAVGILMLGLPIIRFLMQLSPPSLEGYLES